MKINFVIPGKVQAKQRPRFNGKFVVLLLFSLKIFLIELQILNTFTIKKCMINMHFLKVQHLACIYTATPTAFARA